MFRLFSLRNNHFSTKSLFQQHAASTPQMYQVRDRLHEGRIVNVPGPEIADTVAGWLADLDVHSPLVEQLAQAARVGDWAAARSIGDHLSVDINFAS